MAALDDFVCMSASPRLGMSASPQLCMRAPAVECLDSWFSFMKLNCIAFSVALVLVGAYHISLKTPCTLPVTAIVTDVDSAFNQAYGAIESRVTVEYSVDDKKHSTVLRTTTAEHFFKGDEVAMMCDPANPDDAFMEEEVSTSFTGWMFLLTGVLMLVAQAM